MFLQLFTVPNIKSSAAVRAKIFCVIAETFHVKKILSVIIWNRLHKDECDSSLEEFEIEGSGEYTKGTKNQECQLRFYSAKDSHEDKWTCSLESCKLPTDGGCKNGKGSGTISKADINLKVRLYSPTNKTMSYEFYNEI